MRSPLKVAQMLLIQGKRLPSDITAHLVAAGIDVSAMERRFANSHTHTE